MITEIIGTNEENITKSISNVSETLSYVNSIARDLSLVINDIEGGQGTIGAIMKDPQVHTNFNEIVNNLKVFSQKLRDNPSILLFRETENRK